MAGGGGILDGAQAPGAPAPPQAPAAAASCPKAPRPGAPSPRPLPALDCGGLLGGPRLGNGHGKLCQDASCRSCRRAGRRGPTTVRARRARSPGPRSLPARGRHQLGGGGGGGTPAKGHLRGWEPGVGPERTPRRGRRGGRLGRSLLFLAPARSHTWVFRPSWRLGSETPAGPSEAGEPQSWDSGRHGARTGRPSGPCHASPWRRQALLPLTLVPPPNRSETFENKILFVVPLPPPACSGGRWTCAMPPARGAEGGGAPAGRESPRSVHRASLPPARVAPAGPGSRAFGGWVW